MPIPILTGSAMRAADRETISELGVPGLTLMESAGRATAETIANTVRPVVDKRVAVICGKGNNGGDGLVIARQLSQQGARVVIMLLGSEDELSDDAAANLGILQRLKSLDSTLDLEILVYESAKSLDRLDGCEVVVDAMLGTGIESEIREPIRTVVDWINRSKATVVAVDIPTGLSTDTGSVLGAAVRADLTITMAALKVGHLINDGPEHCGRLEVVEIGIPQSVLEKHAASQGCAWATTDDEVARWFRPRAADAHKYSAGTVVAAVGSKRFPGAAVMSVSAASRVGAGYVICGSPKSIQSTLATRLTEVAIVPLDETVDGNIARRARQGLEDHLERASAILVGCGVGRDPETFDFVRELIAKADVPGVVDADGLHALANDKDVLKKAPGSEWVLTPHWGEFRVLVGNDPIDSSDRVKHASRYAREWGCVLLLKGMPSVVGCPDGRVFVNRTGNTGVATAGTGDVLAGFCAGLLAQGMGPVEAAVSALHIGGAAADLFASRADSRTLVATDLVELMPETIKVRFSGIST